MSLAEKVNHGEKSVSLICKLYGMLWEKFAEPYKNWM